MTGIYIITNLINRKQYVGQAINIKKRIYQHFRAGVSGKSSNPMYQEMSKIGITNFTYEVLEECEIDQLNNKEKY